MSNKVVILSSGSDSSVIPNDYTIIWRTDEPSYVIDDDGNAGQESDTFIVNDDGTTDGADLEGTDEEEAAPTLTQEDPPVLLPPSIVSDSITSTVRSLDDGTIVVDVEFDISEVDEAVDYEARYSL